MSFKIDLSFLDDLIDDLLKGIITRIWPAAPAYVAPVMVALLKAATDIVEALKERGDLVGEDKLDLAVSTLGRFLDQALDELPWWRTMPEDARDRILLGFIELAYRIVEAKKTGQSVRDVRRALRQAARTFTVGGVVLPRPATAES